MKKLLKHSLQMGIAFFIIGVALATVGPTVAEAIGYTGDALQHIATANSMPAWTGTFFGMFGAMSAVVPPAVGKMLGIQEKTSDITIEKGKGVSIKLQHQAAMEPSFPYAEPEAGFSAKIIAERENGIHQSQLK